MSQKEDRIVVEADIDFIVRMKIDRAADFLGVTFSSAVERAIESFLSSEGYNNLQSGSTTTPEAINVA